MKEILVAVIVIAGWIVSLCLHEFGHAIVAFIGGDKTVKDKGYLSFNPFAYTNVGLSIVLPTVFVLLGGIGLPGASVVVNERLLRNRFWSVAVSAAGPLMTLLFALALVLVIRTGLFTDNLLLLAAIAYLIELEMVVLILNLLPVPGLDGFGIVEPFLPKSLEKQLLPLHRYGFIILFAILWTVPPANALLWRSGHALVDAAGIPADLVSVGRALYHMGALPVSIACIVIYVIGTIIRKQLLAKSL